VTRVCPSCLAEDREPGRAENEVLAVAAGTPSADEASLKVGQHLVDAGADTGEPVGQAGTVGQRDGKPRRRRYPLKQRTCDLPNPGIGRAQPLIENSWHSSEIPNEPKRLTENVNVLVWLVKCPQAAQALQRQHAKLMAFPGRHALIAMGEDGFVTGLRLL
jgi:hypothetical protein